MGFKTHILLRNAVLQSTKFRLAIESVAYFFCACLQPIQAQVCTDPSGPLVLNQTFGNSSSPLAPGLTAYPYEPESCPNDGQYAIVSSLDGTCFNSTWYGLATDHTPNDVQGSMMIVNGGNKTGPFYEQPLTGLCQGTSYEISFWVINLLRTNTCLNSLVPDLRIRVETQSGTVIQSTSLGRIEQTDAPIWKRQATVFTMPVTESIVIKLINNQGDFGCGNDIVIDDFQVRQCTECVGEFKGVYVPDVFTPNNDGINDRMDTFLSVTGINAYSLRIYDRWGSLIFVSTDPNAKWDGTYAGLPCAAAVYTWVLAYRSGTLDKTDTVHTGHILLMR